MFFRAGDLQLEGLLAGPATAAGVVLCHPHPLYGGNMYNAVVEAVAVALRAAGLATLRFNFRGVGKSGGKHARGEGEVEDALGAIAYLASYLKGEGPIGICGYSFGGMVALRAGRAEPRVAALAGIAPVVDPVDVMAGWAKPKLFVIGSRDEWVEPPQLARLVATMPEPKELRYIEGADHFFFGYEQEVAQHVASFFTTCLPV